MAGFIKGTTTNLLSSSVTVNAGVEIKVCDIDASNSAFVDVKVNMVLDSSATAGLEIYVVREDPGGDATPVVNKYIALSVDAPSVSGTTVPAITFEIPAGVYSLWAKNIDATYSATVGGVLVTPWTWG